MCDHPLLVDLWITNYGPRTKHVWFKVKMNQINEADYVYREKDHHLQLQDIHMREAVRTFATRGAVNQACNATTCTMQV